MKYLIFLLVTLVFASQAFAQSDEEFDCSKPDDLPQMGLNFCADEDFEAADIKLNEIWVEVRYKIRANETEVEEFKGWFDIALTAQRQWLTYRDTQCDAEGFSFNGGSMQSMVVSGCKSRMTEARTQELRQMLEQQ